MIKRNLAAVLSVGLLIILLVGCGPKIKEASGTSATSQENGEFVLLNSFTEKIHASMPIFVFNVYGQRKDDHTNCIRKITVSRMDQQGKIIQEILLNKTITGNYPESGAYGFIIEDMNFDGYKDFRLQQWQPAGPNIPYAYWIWDKAASQFVQNKELEEITSPKIDNMNHVIISYVRDDAVTHSKCIYKYLDGHIKLVKMSTVRQSADKPAHVTIRELRGDELVIVEEYDTSEPGKVLE